MPLTLSLIAVFAQVALTFWAIIQMGRARLSAIRENNIPLSEIELSAAAYPRHAQQMQANAHNQFETPILLYAGVALAAALDGANWGVAAGAVFYIVTRIWHRHIHVTSNHLQTRFKVYGFGLIALALLWLSLALGLVL